MRPRAASSTGAIECAIVDGALPEDSDLARLVVSRHTAGPRFGAGTSLARCRARHTPMCAATIQSVMPEPRIHVVQVFRMDGDDAPASRVLAGLKAAAALPVQVICLPWTIAQTRLADKFRKVCDKAAEGRIIVAAWAQGVDRPIPASFRAVIGVASMGRREGRRPALVWLDDVNAVATPLGPSRGTALLSGLAMVFIQESGKADRDLFAGSLRTFSENGPPTVSTPSVGGWTDSAFERFARRLGRAYRKHLHDGGAHAYGGDGH